MSYDNKVVATFVSKPKICVKWGDVTSQEVKVTNGVKQGGILSLVLFVY